MFRPVLLSERQTAAIRTILGVTADTIIEERRLRPAEVKDLLRKLTPS